jgi:AcrR family transcriptional regulator
VVKPYLSLVWLSPEPADGRRLTRAAVVRAAVSVADETGAAGLTMTAVAGRLGEYSAMALYRYVDSKDGLVDLMLDDVVAEVPLPDAGAGDWRAQLRRVALDSWAMARRHVWYAQLVHTRPPLGPNLLRRTEALLRTLSATGLDLPEALSYVQLLDRHVYAAALADAEERAMLRTYGVDDDGELTTAIQDLRETVAARHPLLGRWMAAPVGPTPEQQLTRGLDFLLDGIAGRIAAASSRGR